MYDGRPDLQLRRSLLCILCLMGIPMHNLSLPVAAYIGLMHLCNWSWRRGAVWNFFSLLSILVSRLDASTLRRRGGGDVQLSPWRSNRDRLLRQANPEHRHVSFLNHSIRRTCSFVSQSEFSILRRFHCTLLSHSEWSQILWWRRLNSNQTM